MIEERKIYIDKNGNAHGGFANVEVDTNGLKLPAGIKAFAYIVTGEKIKPFNPSITANQEGDVLTLPAHAKKELTVTVLCGR